MTLRDYPRGAAGTITASDLVFSGDDSDAWADAGFNVRRCTNLCSAKLVSGEQALGLGVYTVAIDCNGLRLADVGRIIGQFCSPATGIYDGRESPSAIALLWSHEIIPAHNALRAGLPGFGCFAVMS